MRAEREEQGGVGHATGLRNELITATEKKERGHHRGRKGGRGIREWRD